MSAIHSRSINMENEKKIQNEEEKKTLDGTDQSNKENTENTEGNVEEEMVTIPKKEYNIISQHSEDFKRSIELRRLSKLEKKGQPNNGSEQAELAELKEKINSLENLVTNTQASQRNVLLQEAYRQFIGDNKWADDDTIFASISQDFDITGLNTKDEITSKLKSVAISKFPDKYEESLTAKAKAQALAEASNIGVGGGNSGGGENQFAGTGKSEEDKMSEKFMKNFPTGWAINNK